MLLQNMSLAWVGRIKYTNNVRVKYSYRVKTQNYENNTATENLPTETRTRLQFATCTKFNKMRTSRVAEAKCENMTRTRTAC
jgi:hypothetical protein